MISHCCGVAGIPGNQKLILTGSMLRRLGRLHLTDQGHPPVQGCHQRQPHSTARMTERRDPPHGHDRSMTSGLVCICTGFCKRCIWAALTSSKVSAAVVTSSMTRGLDHYTVRYGLMKVADITAAIFNRVTANQNDKLDSLCRSGLQHVIHATKSVQARISVGMNQSVGTANLHASHMRWN